MLLLDRPATHCRMAPFVLPWSPESFEHHHRQWHDTEDDLMPGWFTTPAQPATFAEGSVVPTRPTTRSIFAARPRAAAIFTAAVSSSIHGPSRRGTSPAGAVRDRVKNAASRTGDATCHPPSVPRFQSTVQSHTGRNHHLRLPMDPSPNGIPATDSIVEGRALDYIRCSQHFWRRGDAWRFLPKASLRLCPS